MGGFAWSDEERKILKRNYHKLGPTECHKLIPSRSIDTIQSQARLLGLTTEGKRCGQNIKPNSWTDEELEIVRKNYKDIGPNGCCKLLPKRTPIAIRDTARFLKLTVIGKKWKKSKVAWTEKEAVILKENYLKVSPKKLSELLPRRTLNAIHMRAGILKITDHTRQRRWSPDTKSPEIDAEVSKKYGKQVYRFYLVGNEKYALLEKQDIKKVSQYRWYHLKVRGSCYAYTRINKKSTLMHRMITGVRDGLEVDHWNGNGLDNVRNNLRECTRLQNMWNRPITSNKKSNPYKGVYRRPSKTCEKPWIARLSVNGKRFHFGYYSTAEKAAKVVNKEMLKRHGRFARLNEV